MGEVGEVGWWVRERGGRGRRGRRDGRGRYVGDVRYGGWLCNGSPIHKGAVGGGAVGGGVIELATGKGKGR